MPQYIEISSNAFFLGVPMKLQGNVGIGTNVAEYPIDVHGMSSFNFNASPGTLFTIGSSDARSLSTSSDGNTVVVGKAADSSDALIYVHTLNSGTWTTSNLPIQGIPPNTYSGYTYVYRAGARGEISQDGTRIVATRGFGYTSGNGNVAEIFHKINNSWVSKAYIHQAGSLGWGRAISGDGNTIALTCPLGSDNNYAGNIYVYKYNAGTDEWDQTLSRNYETWPDQITLNQDGTILAFSRTGYPNDGIDHSAVSVATVHILKCTNSTWNSVENDIIINPPIGTINWHYYGKTIRLSADGNTLVVGAPGFNGWGTYGVLNAVHVYKSANGTWINPSHFVLQPASYTSPTTDDLDNMFGNVVTVNSNGTIVVVGAQNADVNSKTDAGRVWVFQFINNVWTIIGTIEGTNSNMRFGSAVDITGNGTILYIAARGLGYGVPSNIWGITKHDFLSRGTAMHINGDVSLKGNMYLNGNISSIGNTNINGTLDVTSSATISGNVGIGTLTANVPLHIVCTPKRSTASYSSITYVDYTTWDAYTNRVSITLNYVDYYGVGLVPDFGFDFIINGKNIRNISYVHGCGFIQFSITPVMFGLLAQTSDFLSTILVYGLITVPSLLIGSGALIPSSVSYYKGSFNGSSAIYIFYDGKNIYTEDPNKWCAIFQSTGEITVLIDVITALHPSSYRLYGIGNGDGTWLVQFPENNTAESRDNLAYRITVSQIYTEPAVFVSGNVGIGTTTPSTALTINGTIRNINGPAPTSGTSLVITGDGDIAPQSSDARYKTNVQDLPPVLGSLMNVRAVSYNWKDETSKWYGLLAQQVAEVFPDAAWHNTEDDTYGVHYTPTVVTLLLKAIQELKAIDSEKTQMIEELTARVQALENK